MALIGSRERQACPSCGRTWERRAAFCGACGDRLEGALPGAAEPPASGARVPGGSSTRRTIASVVAVLALVAAVGGVALVVQSPAAVSGDVGVPEDDAVSTMAPDDPLAPPPPPPEVTCGDDGSTACIAWMRAVSPDAEDTFAMTNDDAVVVSWRGRRGGAGLTVLDAITGERRWSQSLGIEHFSVDAGDGIVLAPGRTEVHALSLATGEQVWTAPTSGMLHGTLLHAGLAFTHRDGTDGEGAHRLEAWTVDDGALAWSWPLPDAVRRTDHLSIEQVDERRVLVSSFEGSLLSVVDVRTGVPVWTADVPANPWGVVGDVVLEFAPRNGDPAGPNPAGDPGAMLTARSVADGTVRWERAVRTSDVGFGRAGDLVLTPSTGLLTAIDVQTGEIRWEAQTEEQPSLAWTPGTATGHIPSPSTDLVITTGQRSGLLRARDPGDGEVVWERDLGTGRDGFLQAALLGDRLVAFTGSGVTYLDPASGEVLVDVRGDRLGPAFGVAPLLVGPSGHVIRVDLGGREDG